MCVERVGHDHELHEIVVRGRAGRLENGDVPPRTLSSISTKTSPSLNRPTWALPKRAGGDRRPAVPTPVGLAKDHEIDTSLPVAAAVDPEPDPFPGYAMKWLGRRDSTCAGRIKPAALPTWRRPQKRSSNGPSGAVQRLVNRGHRERARHEGAPRCRNLSRDRLRARIVERR